MPRQPLPDDPEELRWKYLTIGLTPEQHEWLRQLAFRQRTSIAGLLRNFVDEARAEHDPQVDLPLKLP